MSRRSVAVAVSLALLTPLLTYGGLEVADRALTDKTVTNKPNQAHGMAEAIRTVSELNKRPEDTHPVAATEITEEVAVPAPDPDSKVWDRELFARETSRPMIFGFGPSMNKPVPLNYADDPYRILIVGDSYSYGMFHELTENNYNRRLEQLLNIPSGGAYEVVTLAADQASFLRQSDWITKEKLQEINPDAVVLTYTMNRTHPTFLEEKYCVEFNICVSDGQGKPFDDMMGHEFTRSTKKWRIIMCLRADTGPVSWMLRKVLYPHFTNIAEFVASRYCTDERAKLGLDLPTERTNPDGEITDSPYIGDFYDYLTRVRSAVDAQPRKIDTYVVNLAWMPVHMWPSLNDGSAVMRSIVGPLFDIYEQYGFENIPVPTARRMIQEGRTWELGDLQGKDPITVRNNCVYDCVLTDAQWRTDLEAFAAGLINHPLKYRPGNVIQHGFATDLADFFHKKHPVTATLGLTQPLVVDHMPWYITPRGNEPNRTSIQFSTANVEHADNVMYETGGYKFNTPCARVGHPHAIVGLSGSNVDAAEGMRVQHRGGMYEELLVVFEFEEPNGRRVLTTAVQLPRGSFYDLKDVKGLRSVIVADTSTDCQNRLLKLKPFDVSLELIGTRPGVK